MSNRIEFGLGPGDEQKVVDQPGHVLGLLDDSPERIATIVGRAAAAAQRHLGFPAHDREGRAQLVADVSEKQHTQAVEVLEAAVRLFELSRALADLLLENGLVNQQRLPLRLDLLGHPVEVLR